MTNSAVSAVRTARDAERMKMMADLKDIRYRVEKAFNPANLTGKHLSVTYSVSGYGEMLDVTMHDIATDMYARYRISDTKGESEITTIIKNGDVKSKTHTAKTVLNKLIKNMKEWGVEYDNT